MYAQDKSGWGYFWPLLIPVAIGSYLLYLCEGWLGIDTILSQIPRWKLDIHAGLIFFFGFGMAYLKEYWRENHWF